MRVGAAGAPDLTNACAKRERVTAGARQDNMPVPPVMGARKGGAMTMSAFNVVRMRVKPGRDEDYLAAHRAIGETWPGMKAVNVVRTGERDYCVIGEWDDMAALAASRPRMIETLDSVREMLEDLGDGRGVTDPVSGESVFEVHR
jgi:quinol monooxygenase YgiN